jgi:imidazolonepropionase-like amidohydrolase
MRKSTSHFHAYLLILAAFLTINRSSAQVTFPVNGIANPTEGAYAFINATIIKNSSGTDTNATLIIRDKKIIAIGTNIDIPKDMVIIDCKGKYIYPSFIDLYSDYGMPPPEKNAFRRNFFTGYQFTSNTKGAFGWNQAIKPEVNASALFDVNDKDAKPLRDAGFGSVLTHQQDGIARGTGTLVTLANQPDNLVMLKEKASAQYSFSKGSSTQSYPSSLMGVIALLRQTYYDASWYKSNPAEEGKNMSLEAWNNNQDLPQIFEADDKWNCLRASRIGNEFGVKYILKAGGNEYQRIKEMASINSTFILPLDFPKAMDVEDPNDARYVSLADMENWEMAPTNPAAFEKANIPFCFTESGLKDAKSFFTNLRKAIAAGLSEKTALDALTKNPAIILHIYDELGSLETGKLANFIITNGPVFDDKTIILENWIQGEKYDINDGEWNNISATYNLVITSQDGNVNNYTLSVKSPNSAEIIGKDTLSSKFSLNGKLVNINFSPVSSSKKNHRERSESAINMQKTDSVIDKNELAENEHQKYGRHPGGRKGPLTAENSGPLIRLSGVINKEGWTGNGVDTSGNMLYWTATLLKENNPKEDTADKKKTPIEGKITYPFGGYGWETTPIQQDILIRNATVWTSEKEGVLQNTDVLVKNGKIAAIGKNLGGSAAIIIDGTGKQLTPGIVDEHSHIAAVSINEGGQSVTSEVRIADNLNPDDINIYRQLSGGVTTSHILHGSANTIGGQTQLIKLRWGVNDTALKFAGAAPFIKFALGENVKNTRLLNNNRFPNTRMGVDEVIDDAFTRALDYEKAMKLYENRPKNSKLLPVKRDLELDALVEIMNKKRFITCHSYKASEILAAMKEAEKFGFRFNTFTHVLEGYKVANEMKLHGANASTFSDWWNYKTEVIDAIPQNAGIMQKVGLNVAINSDDAEMARRLNQEAAKSIKYSGMSEEDALKMVTINPATMLHVQERVGSIKAGKDADLVLWNTDPLSIYAIPQKTIIDGIIYYDIERDSAMRKQMQSERNRLIQKMIEEKKSGGPVIHARAMEQSNQESEENEDQNDGSN